MPRLVLIASLVGLFATANALRPRFGPILGSPSFFAAWLTTELGPQMLAAHVIGVTWFIAAGGLHGWEGYTALAACALTAAGLVALVVESTRVRHVLDEATGPSDPYRLPRRDLLGPFARKRADVERIRNIEYAPGGRRYRLDVFRPRETGTGRPICLQIHGGGWSISNKDQNGRPLVLHMASLGWVCFAPNYPLSPRATWPEHIVALKRALAWVREHAHEYGADPNFILVTGGSAGGHLAALVALSQNDPTFQPGFENADTSVQACAPLYGVYDFTGDLAPKLSRGARRMSLGRLQMLERTVLKKRVADHREDFVAASPYHRITSDAPPFFVIHGRNDSLAPVGEARAFVDQLRGVSHNPVAYAELPGAQHAFDVFASIRTGHVVRAIERWAMRMRERTFTDARREQQPDPSLPGPTSSR